MKIVFPVCVFSIALTCHGAANENDNSKLDELGQVPRCHIAFNGDWDSSGAEDCRWDANGMAKTWRRGAVWTKTRKDHNGALKLGGGVYPNFSNLPLENEWTIVVIAKGSSVDNGIIFAHGSGHGRGTRAFGLAGGGKGTVKLLEWWGSSHDAKLLAMKDVVHYDRQFHTYAIVKESGKHVSLWVDGKKAGESDSFEDDGLGSHLTFGSLYWSGAPKGMANGEGAEIDDFRVYDTALTEVQLLQISSRNQPWPGNLPMPKQAISAFVDTNAVLRLGYEIPEQILIGRDGERKLYAKGVLAQCGIGAEKRFELAPGGAFALGSKGFVFDSNYALGRTNEVVFSGGALAAYEPAFIKSAAPIKLTGRVKIINSKQLLVRASIEGPGDIVKLGSGVLGLQYPCDKATGRLIVTNAAEVVIGHAGSWGGTIVLGKGATLKCASTNQVGKIVKLAGAKVIETAPGAESHAEAFPRPATAYRFDKMWKQRMGRGVFAVRQTKDEVMIGWRYKSSDPPNIAFNVYANGIKLNHAPIRDVTYFKTKWTGRKTTYSVTGVLQSGKEGKFAVSNSWTLPADAPVGYFDLELEPPPETVMPDGSRVKHFPCDTSVGDLDGDGELDLVIIWWPDNGADNSHHHKTGNTWIEGVKLDGTNRSLWKIDLGPNIRSGSHYVPVMVADMDGDGKAEVVCRTADGTRDGKGKVIGDASIDWRKISRNGHILWARNFTTVFSGATGEALDSVPFKPDVLSDAKLREDATRRAKSQENTHWDERAINREWSSRNPGNQAFRMLSAVAYLDGVRPSVVMCRGYYSRTCMAAYDFDGKKLKERWYFCSDDPRWWGYGGQGFHNLRVGDVDFDGKDEIIYGHMVVDHDGQGLYTTGMGHGDAIHLIQASPETRGLQVWTCHENSPYGVSLFDAQTGRLHFWTHGPMDTGSCNAMDIDPNAPGVELFSGTHCGIYSASTLQRHPGPRPRPQDNYYGTLRFGIWWMGDLTRSAYSGGTAIKGYSVAGRSVFIQADLTPGEVHSNHGTKGCPALVADIFGDWREEIILTRNDNRALRIFMSPEETKYRFHTFMEDPVYRISVLTQNNGYNVPTDPGFYFGPELLGHDIVFRGTHLK